MRLEDERRAHAFVLLTEREKCMREAAETDTQQDFDETFKQVVKVNQDSVEDYLENVVKAGIDWKSDKTAEEHVLELCDKVDVIAKDSLEK